MNNEKKFLQKLKELTSNHYINWRPLLDLGHLFDEDYFENFKFLLHQNEYHLIKIETSFYGIADDIALLFLNETFESGKDGSINNELNLYYARSFKSTPFQLKLSKDELDSLYTMVSKKAFANYNKENFIEDFLDNH